MMRCHKQKQHCGTDVVKRILYKPIGKTIRSENLGYHLRSILRNAVQSIISLGSAGSLPARILD